MANHASALKRHRQSTARNTRNRAAKARLRTMVRAFEEAVAAGDKQAASEQLRLTSKALAKAASKGLLHHSNASRHTSRLARRLAKLDAQA